ncbi:uncharacterized protein [Lepeophtheirus salmonis]|uniref:uncharacterized protein isoform X2 n=1 Tax=Lepeophtheirus salmonis TaxID=72036 RepID=UPI001AEB47A2|nr:myosin light chain kinase, smooth muscle-like isoform X2 [Lepeophtheirus salmonis]
MTSVNDETASTSFKSKFSIYENGFKNRFKNNNDTNRDLLLCGSLPDLLRIIPKGHVSEVRNRFIVGASPPSSSSPVKRRRAIDGGKYDVGAQPFTPPRTTPSSSSSCTRSGGPSSSTTTNSQSLLFLRLKEGVLKSINCLSSTSKSHPSTHSTPDLLLIRQELTTSSRNQQHDYTLKQVPHPSFYPSESSQHSSVKLRYRTSIRIMVRPDHIHNTRSESAERTDRRKNSKFMGKGNMGNNNPIPIRAIVKEQFRLPRDCSEKMPSASNSPIMSRKNYHRPHPSQLANSIDPTSLPPPGTEEIEEVSKEILRKISRHHNQQLSVASMVRRFETREDFKTRAGVKSNEEGEEVEEEDPSSPKVSSCSSMSSSQGGLRSPDIDEDADLSLKEKQEGTGRKSAEENERCSHPVAPGIVKKGIESKKVHQASLPSSSSSLQKKSPSIPSTTSSSINQRSPGYGAVPKAKGPSRNVETPSELPSGNNKKVSLLQKKPLASKSSSSFSASLKKSNNNDKSKGTNQPHGGNSPLPPSPPTTTSNAPPQEPKNNKSAISNVLRAVNKRSESDGIVLSERPKPEKTVRRCESVDDAVASITGDPFHSGVGFSATPCPATIIKGPEDAIKKVGEAVEFQSHYFGDPDPRVGWSKNGKPLSQETDSRVSIFYSNGISTLQVKDLRGEDGGKYECIVSNDSGSDNTSASLSVPTPPEPPAGRPFVSDIDFASRCLTLAWYGSTFDGGSIVTGYRVEMSSWPITADPEPPVTEDWKILMTDMNSTSYIFKELLPGREYIFRIRCENAQGFSEPSLPSEPVRCQQENDPDEDEDESSESEEEEEEDLDSFEAPFEHRIVALDEGSVFKRKYGVYDELGRGRFGVVFKVKDKETNEILAAKFVKCRRSEDRQKVRDEIEIMNSLDYAKLLQLAAAYENPKEIIMVMEYIGGGELFEKVVQDDFTLTERDCVLFMKQICAAVGYMHSKEIVHLDLKPENILCKSKKSHQIKIIDFGLTRKLKPPDEVRILFGTPEFVSPEVINYEPVSTTSDMWSVGVVCYVLLSGLSPFMGDSDAETFGNISGIRYDFEDEAFDNISDESKDFIKNLLVKNQNERLSAYECLQHAWLAPGAEKTAAVKTINTEKLKSFLMRRKWQKAAHAIRALGRFTSLGFRGDGKGSSSSISGFSTQSADF